MNSNQKTVLLIGIFLFVIISFFPPYESYATREGVELFYEHLGYHSIIKAPTSESSIGRVYIDFNKLLVQWLFIIISTLAFILYFENDKVESQIKPFFTYMRRKRKLILWIVISLIILIILIYLNLTSKYL